MGAHPSIGPSDASPIADWIELHDKLPVDERSFVYHERNQRDWWEQNKRIRKGLLEAEAEIKRLIRTGKVPSVRILSWSQLAARIGCNRATLKQVRRHHWVNERLNQLLALLHTAKEHKNTANDQAEVKLSEIKFLEVSLQNQRNQTAAWYSKYLDSEERVTDLERLLVIRERKIEELVARK